MEKNRNKRVLIIVENLTIPLDRRVWQEATALRDEGYTVSIICPTGGEYQKSYELMEDIHVYRHPLPFEADTKIGYLLEYSSALFWEFILSLKVLRKQGFDVIHACNPPDLIFLIGLFYKFLMRKKFIFDHHDINPELFEVKFGRKGFFHSLLLKFERMTFWAADASLATNQTFKQIAVERGKMKPENVYIVQSTPNLAKFKKTEPSEKLRAEKKHVIGYVGIMGSQDGVDILIESIRYLVNEKQIKDLQCVIVGSGTELQKLQTMATDYKLDEYITFTGYLSGNDLLQAYSTFDIGVIPDPENVYNDKISMNKVFEYMAMGIPFVQFDLAEGRHSAGDSSLYARNNDPVDLANQMHRLMENPELGEKLGKEGQNRAKNLNWDHEKIKLLEAYRNTLS